MALIGISNWWEDALEHKRADLMAGLTLWALLIPQSIAYAKLAGAPSPVAGLYCVMIVLPVYAIFASSRLLVPSPTTAVSATFAGFLAAMISEPEMAFPALVIATSLAYFLFYFLRLGFLTDFISAPVSMGYLSGLSMIVIVGQFPKLLGFDVPAGNIVEQGLAIWRGLESTNFVTMGLSVVLLFVIVGLPRLSKKIPAGLVALILAILVSWGLALEERFGVSMVGALPSGFPQLTLPLVDFADLAVIVPAAIGLVILASGEASVTAQGLASKYGRQVDINQQFFAFGMGNLAGGFFGAMIGSGASSASMVNDNAGARTLMSSIWAGAACLLTLLFLTGVFAYLPNAFLAALVITAVVKMLNFRKIYEIIHFARGEFLLAVLAQIAVLVFGILNGLVITMLINVLYAAFVSSKVRISAMAMDKDNPSLLLPVDNVDACPLPDKVLAFALTEGQIYYASAREAFAQGMNIVREHPECEVVVVSFARVVRLDYSSLQILQQLMDGIARTDKILHITDIYSNALMAELRSLRFDENVVHLHITMDLRTLKS